MTTHDFSAIQKQLTRLAESPSVSVAHAMLIDAMANKDVDAIGYWTEQSVSYAAVTLERLLSLAVDDESSLVRDRCRKALLAYIKRTLAENGVVQFETLAWRIAEGLPQVEGAHVSRLHAELLKAGGASIAAELLDVLGRQRVKASISGVCSKYLVPLVEQGHVDIDNLLLAIRKRNFPPSLEADKAQTIEHLEALRAEMAMRSCPKTPKSRRASRPGGL